MAQFDGLKMLIAEDEPFMRGILEKTLRAERAWVAGCADGMEALALARSPLVVDVVLLDFMMPQAHGLYVLQQIRAGRTNLAHNIPVGLLTGAKDERALTCAVMLHCDAFILKPIKKTDMIARIDRLWQRVGRKIEEPSAYKFVDVGLPDDINSIPYSASTKPASETPAPSGAYVRLGISELLPGMVTDEDLITCAGDFVAPSGTVVTDGLLDLLRDLDSVRAVHAVAIRTPFGTAASVSAA